MYSGSEIWKRIGKDEDVSAAQFKVHPIESRSRVFYDFDNSKIMNRSEFDACNMRLWRAYDARKQRKHEVAVKMHVWKMLQDTLRPNFPDAYLAIGGSTINYFGTRNSDLDLCLAMRCGTKNLYEEEIAVFVLEKVKNILETQPYIDSIEIVFARVPILKILLMFPFNDFEVDINCNCVAGIFNSHLLSYYAQIDERVPAMTTYLKDWAYDVKVVDPKCGGVNSYTIVLMVIHFLQCAVDPPILPNLIALYPDLFSGSGNVEELVYDRRLTLPKIAQNKRSLGELMYGFLNYYEQFDYENIGISIREACLFDRRSRPRDDLHYLFFIEEAYDGLTVPKNLVKLSKLEKIKQAFQEARDYLLIDLIGGIPPHLMIQSGVMMSRGHLYQKCEEEDFDILT